MKSCLFGSLIWCIMVPVYALLLRNAVGFSMKGRHSLHRFASVLSTPSAKRIIADDSPSLPRGPIDTSDERQPSAKPLTTGTYIRQWPEIHPPEVHYKRALRSLRDVKIDPNIKNVRNQQRKYSAQQLDALMKALSVPISQLITLYSTGFRNLHPYEKTVSDLTFIAREKKGDSSLSTILQQLRDLRHATSILGKHFAAQAKAANSAIEAKEILKQGFEALEGLYKAQNLTATSIPNLPENLTIPTSFTSSSHHVLQDLLTVHQALKKIPVLELETPTMVLVGAPNVGKSSLVRVLSSGTPEVGDYPFTTRGVSLGHLYLEREVQERDIVEELSLSLLTGKERKRAQKQHEAQFKCQVMDTPGLLDRPEEERNEMERLTFASLLHLPTAVLFVLDHSGLSGQHSSLAQQLHIRAALKARFPKRPWFDVLSKADLSLSDDALSLLRQYNLEPIADLQQYIQARERYLHQAKEVSDVAQPLLWVSVQSKKNIDVLEIEVQSMLHRLRQFLAQMR